MRQRTLAAAAAFAVLCALVAVGARAVSDSGGSTSSSKVATATGADADAGAADTTSASAAETTLETPTTAPTTTIPGPLPCPPDAGAAERVATFAFAPPDCLSAGTTYRAVVRTSEGSFTITLDPKGAPRNVNSFVYLARYRFFDGLAFDRVVPGFIVQGGDPVGDGSGGPGYTIPDELPSGVVYRVGTVAMANSGPNTNGSQFFVVSGSLGNELPRSYPVLGTVTSGLDVVRKIDALGVAPAADGSEKPPIRRITIERIAIETELASAAPSASATTAPATTKPATSAPATTKPATTRPGTA